MKRILLSFFALLMIGSNVNGQVQEGYTIQDINLPLGGEAELQVAYNFTARDCKGLQFNIDLPDGLEFVKKESVISFAQGFYSTDNIAAKIVEGSLLVSWFSSDNTPIHRKEGVLIGLKVKATGTPSVGDVFNCTLRDAIRTLPSGEDEDLADCNFKVTIKAANPSNYVILDENSLFAPSGGNNKKVHVKRTLKKDFWNTICLPFAMTNDQLKTAFGDDVIVAAFDSWTYDAEKGIIINFNKTNSIENGKPYIIKVSSAITEFDIESVNLRTSLFPTNIEGDEGSGVMSGNLNLTTLDSKDLFIQDNKFYFAIQGQTIKGLRAKFRFKDWDDSVIALTRGMFTIDGQSIGDGTTGINSLSFIPENGKVYSLSGQFMGEKENLNCLPKGVYIVDGKKMVIK